MKAIHGGKAKNDKIDSHNIAMLLRGGMGNSAFKKGERNFVIGIFLSLTPGGLISC